ncbi:MAG: transporter related protein [Acidimicrobiaceae bacterium]|nr:transporter related protein [Acidimicrobiaceae bacterium]
MSAGLLERRGRRGDRIFDELESSPFEPLAEPPRYPPPRAAVDPDSAKSWLRRALPLLRAHRALFAVSLTMSFIALLAQVQIPNLIGTAIDRSLRAHAVPLEHYAVLIGAAIAIREVANYVGRRYLLETAYAIEYDMRNEIYAHLSSLSFPFYDRVQSGQLISRSNSDVRAVQMYLALAPTVFVQCAVVVIAFVEMFTINVPLTLVTMASLPLTFAVAVAMRKKMFPVSWLIQARLAEVATIVEENVGGIRVVKSFAAEQRQLSLLARAADRVRWSYEKDADIRGTWAPTIENLPRVGLAVILLYGGLLVLHGHLQVGTLFTFQAYMLLFQAPFRQLGMVIMMGQRASASAGRIYEILDERPEVVNRPGAEDLGESAREVRMEDASFAYADGTPVLDHFQLHLGAGETVALVGRTGSGKSTVARLLNRSYDVTGGRITIDGRDVAGLTLESLRARVGVVTDDPFLFSVSIRDNIAYGRPDAPLEEVVAAARAADADGFVSRLPKGYDTVVGERGYTLSGGQRQRIAIARTLLVNPPILVLDDATSAIDVQVEQRIHASLGRILEGRTTLVIAHRLSTIALADRVVLLEGGRIVASGTHSELMESEPRYAQVLARIEEDDQGPEGSA